MTRDGESPEPLAPDERALARALSRAAPAGQVADTLDAAILAAARAEVAAREANATAGVGSDTPVSMAPGAGAPGGGAGASLRPPRRGRRTGWLRGAALAASLVVAVGVAWQLKPQLDAPDLAAPSGVATPGGAAGTSDTTDGMRDPAGPATRERAARRQAESAPGHGPDPAPTSGGALESGTPPGVAAAEPAVASPAPGESAPAAPRAASPVPPSVAPPPPPPPAPPAPPPPPPAPPAPPAPVVTAPAPASVPSNRPAAARATDAQAASLARFEKELAAEADEADGLHLDQPVDDTPPASLSSPSARDAWLSRIRQLLADGREDDARASYAEFRRRHPDARVPDDLRDLLDE